MSIFLAASLFVASAAVSATPHIHGTSAPQNGRLVEQLPKALLEKVVRASLSVAQECHYAPQASKINRLLEDEVDMNAHFPDVATIQGTKVVDNFEDQLVVLETYLQSILGKFMYCATAKVNAKLRKNMTTTSKEKEFATFSNKVVTHIGEATFHKLTSKAREEAMKTKQQSKMAAMVMHTPTPVFAHVSGTKLVDRFLKKDRALLEQLVRQSVAMMAADVGRKVKQHGKPGWLEPYVLFQDEITEVIGEKLRREILKDANPMMKKESKEGKYEKLKGTKVVDLFVKLKETELLEKLVHEAVAKMAFSEKMKKFLSKEMLNSDAMKKSNIFFEKVRQIVGEDYGGLKDKLKMPHDVTGV